PLPVAVDPAQVVRQLPPEILSTATTLIPLDKVAIFVELVYGRDRSTTPSHLVANVLSASAGAGLAASNAVTMSASEMARSRSGRAARRRPAEWPTASAERGTNADTEPPSMRRQASRSQAG